MRKMLKYIFLAIVGLSIITSKEFGIVIGVIGLIVLAVSSFKAYDYSNSTYAKNTHNSYFSQFANAGKSGEYLTFRELEKYENQGAKFLFNVYVPIGEEKYTEIDCLMINQDGFFVIESKNYSGDIYGTAQEKQWYQWLPTKYYFGKKNYFYNPIWQNRGHISHLRRYINYSGNTYSLIVFSNRCTLHFSENIIEDAYVIYRSELTRIIDGINANNTNKMSQQQVEILYNDLYPLSQATEEIKQKHLKDTKQKNTCFF